MAPSLSVRDPDGHLQSKACSSLGKEEWWSWRRLHQRLVSSAVGGVVEVLRVLLYRLQSRLQVAVDKGRDAYVRVHFPIQAVYTMSQGYTWCCPYTSRTVLYQGMHVDTSHMERASTCEFHIPLRYPKAQGVSPYQEILSFHHVRYLHVHVLGEQLSP